VRSLIRDARGGALNTAEFGTRFVGTGPYAALLNQRFKKARTRLGLDRNEWSLDLAQFQPPPQKGDQFKLF
jgi:hypothetical protein